MNQKVMKFALGEAYTPDKEEVLGVVLLCLFMETVKWLFNAILFLAFFLILGVGQWIICAILVFPAGRYVRLKEDEYPRIPFWPKIFGMNIWLYVVIPPALWAHYGSLALAWWTALLVGVGCAIAIPVFWHVLTLPIQTQKEPGQ